MGRQAAHQRGEPLDFILAWMEPIDASNSSPTLGVEMLF
jgi:hypothetical protein